VNIQVEPSGAEEKLMYITRCYHAWRG